MADIVVTCPKHFWAEWLAEGDAAGEPYSGEEWGWFGSGKIPPVVPGDRLYVVSHGRLRGFAPVTRLQMGPVKTKQMGWGRDVPTWAICRRGDAQAVTIAEPVRGFQSWRRVWWSRSDEQPFADWKTAGVTLGR